MEQLRHWSHDLSRFFVGIALRDGLREHIDEARTAAARRGSIFPHVQRHVGDAVIFAPDHHRHRRCHVLNVRGALGSTRVDSLPRCAAPRAPRRKAPLPPRHLAPHPAYEPVHQRDERRSKHRRWAERDVERSASKDVPLEEALDWHSVGADAVAERKDGEEPPHRRGRVNFDERKRADELEEVERDLDHHRGSRRAH